MKKVIDADESQERAFLKILTDMLKDLRVTRKTRVAPEPGYSYRRDIVDRFIDDDQLRPRFFIQQYKRMLEKRCKLPLRKRRFIHSVMNAVMNKMKRTKANKNKSKPKTTIKRP